MRRFWRLCAGFGAMLGSMLPGTLAQATVSRTFVSSTGMGTTCSRAQPCADFQTAHDATTSGGTIFCLDPGD